MTVKQSGPALEDPPRAEETTMLGRAAAASGASAQDVKAAEALGQVDAADDQVDQQFAAKKRGDEDSPIVSVIWGTDPESITNLLFEPDTSVSDEARVAMNACLSKARELVKQKRLFGANGKIAPDALKELAEVGYLRLLIPKEYGGFGISIPAALEFQEKMAAIHEIMSLFISVHGMIGAVNPLRLYGNDEQKARWFPQLAVTSSAFGLTEPGAGSDVKNLRTTAVLDGDELVINGEKMFITNLWYDRIVSLVVMFNDGSGKLVPRVVIIRTPESDNEHFTINRYGLHALKNAYNVGARFTNFRAPLVDMLDADGLEIAFNGLNAARIAVDANSHVGIQELVRDVIGWVRYRITFHKPIGERELVEARLGRMLALMSACRALRKYCSAVLQQDFRGEAECVVAKTFGSDAAWEVVSDQYWKTIGGRVLLHGNPGGDKIHDIGAERTYEGENSMLLMKLFSTLVKVVGKKYLQPMINGVTEAGIKLPKIRGPLDGLLFGLKHPLTAFQLTMLAGPFALFLLRRTLWFKTKALLGHRDVEAALPKNMPAELRAHAKWAIVELQRMSIELSVAMLVTYRETLQDRQNRIVDLATKAQRLFVMVVTATQNAREDDKQLQMAAALMCRDLKRLVLSPSRSDAYYRAATKLGRALYTDGCPSVEHIHEHGVLAAYNDANELDMETVKPPTY